MEYAILVYESPDDIAARSDPARSAAYIGAYTAYSQALLAAGVMTGGAGLMPPATATTLRIGKDRRHVHDGPFADTKEQLGGMFVIEVPDLDTALTWAARCPAATRSGVEVRPVLPPPPELA
jgi:hypothetical protein